MRPKTPPTASQPPTMPAKAPSPVAWSNVRRESRMCSLSYMEARDRNERPSAPVLSHIGCDGWRSFVAVYKSQRTPRRGSSVIATPSQVLLERRLLASVRQAIEQ